MNPARRVGSRAPLIAVGAVVALLVGLLLSLLPGPAQAAGWTTLRRVTDEPGSRLDSLHQLAADRGRLHLVYPRIGPGLTDDRILYQRSRDGAAWSEDATLFEATKTWSSVAPNLALAARGGVVAAVWRVAGPDEHALFVRVSRDGGRSFRKRELLFTTSADAGIGVPAVAVASGGRVIAVAWTDRANGKIKLRVSPDRGATFGKTRILGRTRLSIDCRRDLTDGLVGLAASDRVLHAAWSESPKRQCQASSIRARTSDDAGVRWSEARTVTDRRSYGWPELDARGDTVLATVQATSGDIIVSRSGDAGGSWDDRLVKAPKGHSFSAADVVLLARGRGMITYVNETVRRARLVSTKVVTRWSPDDGATLRQPKAVTPEARRLRMAPNLAAIRQSVTIVVQSGPLSGSPRNVFASRRR
jgi:hypothetical protein